MRFVLRSNVQPTGLLQRCRCKHGLVRRCGRGRRFGFGPVCHLGEAEERNGDYFGPVVNLAARVESAGHGGQTLVTDVVRQAAQSEAQGPRDLQPARTCLIRFRIFQIGSGEFPPVAGERFLFYQLADGPDNADRACPSK